MDRINFQVNGVQHSVGSEVSSSTSLLEYLRKNLELRGTKYMCLEGGCGACIVNVSKSPGSESQGVNSCLVPITSCNEWDITTIEKIGNRLQGYHPLQKTLAESNGSQCGYCSPGWVMAMYSILKNKKPTILEIEQSFGGNICRCTGYRPILEAFKKFASDAPVSRDILDIEDLNICKKFGQSRSESCDESDWCIISKKDVCYEMLHIVLSDNRDWYRATTVSHIFELWKDKGTESYMLVAGNTAKGVYPIMEYPRLLININNVSELHGYYIDQNLVIGAAMTLTDLMNIFKIVGAKKDFQYLNVLNDHMKLVAHTTIKNSATIGGNLILKNRYPEFKSDIYILLETVGAQLTILSGKKNRKVITMQEYLKESMSGKIIKNILFPPLNDEYKIVTYKIMPRSQNAHALVHAGFCYKIDQFGVVKHCRIIYGGLTSPYIRFWKTEQYLVSRRIFQNNTLQGALQVLSTELVVTGGLPESSVQYRRHVALALFYKGLLSLCPLDTLHSNYVSGATKIHDTRPVSHGKQSFEVNPDIWPINKPIPKLDALLQCSGEAEYTEDLPTLPQEVYAAFVLTTVALGTITEIDATKALAEPGVIAFYSAVDIPGKNSFVLKGDRVNRSDEEILCGREVKYYNQPLGIIVAKYQNVLEKAVNLVDVKYSNIKQPIVELAIAKRFADRVSFFAGRESTTRGRNIVKVIKGEQNINWQYYFTMETLVGITHRTEEGLRVYATTQGMDNVQVTCSRTLLVDENRIDIHVRRLGGAYGYKLSRSTPVALASSLVAYKLNRPCRFLQSLRTNMRATGKRSPCSTNYEIGVDDKGVIQYLEYDLYSDSGCVVNEIILAVGVELYNNAYKSGPWKYRSFEVKTDTPSNSWCRAPGSIIMTSFKIVEAFFQTNHLGGVFMSLMDLKDLPRRFFLKRGRSNNLIEQGLRSKEGSLEHVAMAETMVERIAYEMNLDSFNVRVSNLDTNNYSEMVEMIERIKVDSQYEDRILLVHKFNVENRWKKRGLKVSFLRWNAAVPKYFDLSMSVYKDDGTVAITHGGIEMGQGINTIAVQVCAYFLGIPLEKIQIKPSNTIEAPNNSESQASVTTQNVGMGVQKCCKELLRRLEPARLQLKNPTWLKIIQKAYSMHIDLQVHGFVSPDDAVKQTIYGVTVAEVEIDVLTGEWEILRVDLIEDVGRSVNPDIDIGQVEGAFTMGIGYWTTENIVHSPVNGELLTDRTWEYWVPGARDIPQDFRIYFRKRSFSNEAILGSKATGEPATCMGIVIPFAIRGAIASAREESGIPSTEWFQIDGPFTVDKICTACSTRWTDFKYY